MSHDAFPSPSVVIGNTGQTKIVQNAGAKRIAGTDLLTKGKIPQYIYYLIDIQSLVFYANDATDTWIGGFGQPVAGTLALRDSLSPFEGQKFYIVATDVSYTFKGGVWEGGVTAANVLAPKFLILNGATTLTRGRCHIINADGAYLLPLASSITLGDSLDGHHLQFFVARGVTTVSLNSTGPDFFIDDNGNDRTILNLNEAGLYDAVFKNGKWEIFYLDTALFLKAANNLSDLASVITARTNLDVFSKAETHTTIDAVSNGTGILDSGTSATGDKKFAADFATDVEAADPSNAVKVLAPKNVAQAVTAATRSSEFNNVTGLLPKSTETKFLFTQDADPTKVNYPEFSVVFNAEPFIRDTPLVNVTVPAGTIILPVSVVTTTHRVIYRQATNDVILQTALPPLSTTDEIVLGSIVELNGNVFNGILIANPWLSSTDYNIRITPLNIVSGGIIKASATVGKVDMSAILLGRESINWEQSTSQPHQKTIALPNPVSWFYADQAGAILGGLTDEVDGEHLDDEITPVGNSNFSIQVAFIGSEGDTAVLKGQLIYANLTDALAAVDNYSPVIPPILTTALEFSRWVVKGNQYPGSASLDLTDLNNFQVSQGADVTGGIATVNAGDVSSSNSSNTLSTTNLQTQVDELSHRTSWERKTGGGAVLLKSIIANDSGTYTLPALPTDGVGIRLSAFGGVAPIFNVSGGGEQIVLASDGVTADTGFQIEAVNNGVEFELVSNGTNWEL